MKEEIHAERSAKEIVADRLPKRQRDSHKGTYGRAAIVAGCMQYTGAAYLAAAACLRAGAGYTTLFVPEKILPYYALKAPEAILKPLCGGEKMQPNADLSALLEQNSVAYGMGMGVSEAVAEGAVYLLNAYTGKLVLDADGLNSLAAYKRDELRTLFRNKRCDVLLTPHQMEFSRLSGKTLSEIRADGETVAMAFAEKYGVNVLLKGAFSVMTDGRRVFLNETGNSGQAKGGSGDVLSGVIAGLCASGADAFDGGLCGAYLVGKAAELASKELSEYSVTATDLIARLGKAFLDVLS